MASKLKEALPADNFAGGSGNQARIAGLITSILAEVAAINAALIVPSRTRMKRDRPPRGCERSCASRQRTSQPASVQKQQGPRYRMNEGLFTAVSARKRPFHYPPPAGNKAPSPIA